MDKVIEKYKFSLEILLSILQKKPKSYYITAAVALITFQQVYSFFRVPKNLRGFPAVSFIKMANSFATNMSPLERLKKIILPVAKKGKGYYVSKIPLGWRIYVTDPVIAKNVLLKSDKFPKAETFGEIVGTNSFAYKLIGQDNIGMSNGHMWKNQRRAMNPAFYGTPPVELMEKVVQSLFLSIETNPENFPVKKNMHNLTLDVLGFAIFDFNFKALHGDPEGWTETYSLVMQTLLDPFFIIFPSFDLLARFLFPKREKGIKAVTRLNAKFDEVIAEKRSAIKSGFYKNVAESKKDVLTLMLESEAMTDDDELRHNIAMLFIAGHDTTANALSFCLYHLAKNKRIQDKLREEVISVIGAKPSGKTLTFEELKNMKYMNAIIKENLRLNGPVDILFSRMASCDVDIMGTIIPEGASITIDLSAIHHNPDYWKNSEVFDPERFNENGEHDSHQGFSWVPFSNGTRQCLGMNFSLTEQRLALAMIVQKYEIDIPRDSKHYDHIVFDSVSTIAPSSLELSFTKRH